MDGVSSAIQLLCRGLSLGAKGRLHFACVCSVTLYCSETWPVKEEDVIGLEMNDARLKPDMFGSLLQETVQPMQELKRKW